MGPPGSKLTVHVVVDNLGRFDGYNVAVRTDSSILYPVSVNFTGAVLQGASYFICVNEDGPQLACGWEANTPGTVEIAAHSGSTEGNPTGPLFSITYDILARSERVVIHFIGRISASGIGCFCIWLSTNSGKTLVTDTQGAGFRNLILGDLNGDCKVDILDVAITAVAFDTREGDVRWNPDADINGDGRVDIVDVAMAAANLGKTC